MGTKITIELTDDQVAELRSWATAMGVDQHPTAHAGRSVGAVARLAYAALPPEPVKVTVELPVTLAEKIRTYQIHVSPDHDADDLWRLVARALTDGSAR